MSINGWADYDEYGVSKTGQPQGVTYGWLGKHERSASIESAGLTLMGVRLYNPVRGAFTTTDPVAGGNSTAYAYPQDPVNMVDLDGKLGYTYTFSLGKSKLSASKYFSQVRSRFTSLFPFKGRKKPKLGAVMKLKPLNIPLFPVKVKTLVSTGWTFGTLKGHLDHPGSIQFKFYKSNGQMRLKVIAKIGLKSKGGVCMVFNTCRSAMLSGTYVTWWNFARTLKNARIR